MPRAPPQKRAAARRKAQAALAPPADASATNSLDGWYAPEGYTMQAVLGSGSYGKVFKALKVTTGKPVAIKVLVFDEASKSPDPRKEVGRNIVRMFDWFCGEMKTGSPVQYVQLILEFCSTDLSQVIQSRVLTGDEVVCYMGQICDGLIYVHGQGVVHRDLKPANILLTAEGVIKIADFGTARQICSKRFMEKGVCTAWYCAPELFDLSFAGSYGRIATSADMWSAGCILAEMMSGRRLFPQARPQGVLAEMKSQENDGSIKTFLAQQTVTCVNRDVAPWPLTDWQAACEGMLERLVCFDHKARLSARELREMLPVQMDAGVITDDSLAGEG
ncbi:Mitogen-activated protein kinase 14B [Geranomyces variabilis]|uniref:non-specific serine/threonine protein kinase n=1 Tax=Geranomyces variabilis TaxID=109894 RepID=A0AAD5TJX0_9FUNG|nr:Mitogen-activated protein kinase 14B [Geranomyces variabilis]